MGAIQKVLLLILLSLFFDRLLLAGESKTQEERSFTLSPGANTVTVIGDEGTITVRTWDKNEALLRVTKKVWDTSRERAEELLKELEIDISHSGDRLYIRHPDIHNRTSFRFADAFDSNRWRSGPSVEIDFDLTVPHETHLKIENDEGDIDVTGVAGDLRVRVDEGSVFIADLKSKYLEVGIDEGELVLKNSSSTSETFLRADEGTVRVSDAQLNSLNVASDEGDVVLKGVSLKNCDAATDEGEILLDLNLATDSYLKIQTEEGDIKLVLAPDIEAQFSLETGEGRIRSDFPVSIREDGNDGEQVEDVIGGGAATIRANTESGDIVLQKKAESTR